MKNFLFFIFNISSLTAILKYIENLKNKGEIDQLQNGKVIFFNFFLFLFIYISLLFFFFVSCEQCSEI